MSVRGLASKAGVSPAYVTAIELGRNPTTGRPPVPSIRVVAQLSSALELDFARVIATIGAVGADVGGAEEHVLLYCIGERGRDILGAIDRLFGGSVDHWLYIADPREGALCTLAARATVCRWNLGTFPYDHSHLDPRKILDALDLEVGRLAPTHIGERVGLAIADCSAVMRWVQNAEAEVEFERTWHGHTQRIWRERLDGFPAIDVCVYQHADIDAIGLNIDQVSTALDLVRVHDRIVVLDQEGDVMTGAPAIRRILELVRPSGISTAAWSDIGAAAAESLAKDAIPGIPGG